MTAIFSLFAEPLGWVMHWIYLLIDNYFVTLLLFTLLVRLVLFPLSIKNQKNQADRARLAPRLERIQKKYGQDRQKMAMKQQELYEKEGVKMTAGCLPMLFQMLVLFSVIAVIYKPVTYIQRGVTADQLNTCIEVAVDNMDEKEDKSRIENMKNEGSYYRELYLFEEINAETRPAMELALVNQELSEENRLSNKIDKAMTEKIAAAKALAETAGETFDEAKFKTDNAAAIEAEVTAAFYTDNAGLFVNAKDVVATIEKTGEEFSLFGVSLLDVPRDNPNVWLLIIVAVSGITAFLSGKLSMSYSKAAMSAEQQQMGGCSNGMMLYMMPIMSLIFSFTVPAGVAVYWIFSNLLAMVQTVVLNAMYNPAKIRAQAEAEYAERRRKRREDKERLKAARLAEQAAWQEEENKARARAKGDITQKKSAAPKATPAALPSETVDEVPQEPVSDTVEEE